MSSLKIHGYIEPHRVISFANYQQVLDGPQPPMVVAICEPEFKNSRTTNLKREGKCKTTDSCSPQVEWAELIEFLKQLFQKQSPVLPSTEVILASHLFDASSIQFFINHFHIFRILPFRLSNKELQEILDQALQHYKNKESKINNHTYGMHGTHKMKSNLLKENFTSRKKDINPVKKNEFYEKYWEETSKMAEIGLIGSSIAHELNSPLGGMISFIQLMKMNNSHHHIHNNDLLADLLKMENDGNTCKKTIENLLYFSKPPQYFNFSKTETLSSEILSTEILKWEKSTPDKSFCSKNSEDWTFDLQDFDLKEVVQQSLQIMELEKKNHNFKWFLHIPDQEMKIKGQPHLLTQAIYNLLRNAKDSIEMKAKIEPIRINSIYEGRIRVVVETQEDKFIINIIDNGIKHKYSDYQNFVQSFLKLPIYPTNHHEAPLQRYDFLKSLSLMVAHQIILEHDGQLSLSPYSNVETNVKISLKRLGQTSP